MPSVFSQETLLPRTHMVLVWLSILLTDTAKRNSDMLAQIMNYSKFGTLKISYNFITKKAVF